MIGIGIGIGFSGSPKWTPAQLGNNLGGAPIIADAVSAGKIWQDSGKTLRAYDGSPVAVISDPWVHGLDWVQGSGSTPATLRTDGYGHWWLELAAASYYQASVTLTQPFSALFAYRCPYGNAGQARLFDSTSRAILIDNAATSNSYEIYAGNDHTAGVYEAVDRVVDAEYNGASSSVNLTKLGVTTNIMAVDAGTNGTGGTIFLLTDNTPGGNKMTGRFYGAVFQAGIAKLALIRSYLSGLIPPVIDPASLSGQLLRLDTAGLPGTTTAISTWVDGSGNSKDATQATSALRPTATQNIMNYGTVAVARFNGNFRLVTPSISLGTQYTLIAVVNQGSDAATDTIVNSQNNLFWGGVAQQLDTLFGGGVSFGGWTAPAVLTPPSTSHVFTTVINGSSQTDYLDGYLIGQTTLANPTTFATALEIGGAASLAAGYGGDLAHVQIIGAALGAGQVVSVQSYLTAKFAIPAGQSPFTIIPGNVIEPVVGTWKSIDVANPNIFRDTPNSRWIMNFSGWNGMVWREGIATAASLDGPWTENANNPLFNLETDETYICANASIVYLAGTYYCYYMTKLIADNSIVVRVKTSLTCLPGSWTLASSSIIELGSDVYDFYGAGDPYATVMADGTTIELLYMGFAAADASLRNFCRATSTNGTTFTKHGPTYPSSSGGLPAFVTSATGYDEPVWVRDPTTSTRITLFHDWAPDGLVRRIAMATSTDNGATWGSFQLALGPSPVVGNLAEVFDPMCVINGGWMYLFHSGSDSTSGLNEGLNAVIRIAKRRYS